MRATVIDKQYDKGGSTMYIEMHCVDFPGDPYHEYQRIVQVPDTYAVFVEYDDEIYYTYDEDLFNRVEVGDPIDIVINGPTFEEA